MRVNADWKSAFLKSVGHFRPKCDVGGDVHYQPFLHDYVGQ